MIRRQSAVDLLISNLIDNDFINHSYIKSREDLYALYKRIIKHSRKVEIEQQERLIDMTLNAFAMRDNLETNKRNG